MIELAEYYKEMELKDLIQEGSPIYFFRSTPFTDHGEFNYNGMLTPDFFFKNLFSPIGKCLAYIDEIKNSLINRQHKSILLIGNQGCGKTTFVHYLEQSCLKNAKERGNPTFRFVFFDFDQNTSHPTLSEYIELLSNYLLQLMKSDKETNILLFDLYEKNRVLINQKINASNNIETFFRKFNSIFLLEHASSEEKDDFIKDINVLFFNQILSLITLWHICKCKSQNISKNEIAPLVFCLDNLDVLVNQEIIEQFFKEYFRFVRNIDSIIQKIDDSYIRNSIVSYNRLFTFIFSCRQHTWARVKQHYRHDRPFIHVSTFNKDITDAFDKREILNQRELFIKRNFQGNTGFLEKVASIKQVISDMDSIDGQGHNIYDLFDDDYRQCNLTFESIVKNNPNVITEYEKVKKQSDNKCMNGARGIIYKSIFEEFKKDGLFNQIGVLDLEESTPLVSNARMILNYLNYKTYTKDKNTQKYIRFEKLVEDFKGIIDKDDLNNSLIAMFKLGDDSLWNELIAFNEINDEVVSDCNSTEIFITQAGHEYLDLIATHFEFFNIRVVKKRNCNCPLFSSFSYAKSENSNYVYNFQEIIQNVYDIVNQCCEKMSIYYENVMKAKYENIDKYLTSPYVYSEAKVLHSERIIHTHIRYIDQYRLYLLNNVGLFNLDSKIEINKLLIAFIKNYIEIGDKYTNITSTKSIDVLFPAFLDKIKIIHESDYKDFNTKIDIK